MPVEPPEVSIILTVYLDAVKTETEESGCRRIVGWFRDEVSAISAATERIIIQSALLPTLRKIPQLSVISTYDDRATGRDIYNFVRGTKTRFDGGERRVVKTPGASAKTWLR